MEQPIIAARASHLIKMNPAWVWPPSAAAAEPVEPPPYEGYQPVENMNDTGSYGFYAAAIWGVAQSFTALRGGKLTSAKVYARRNLGNVDHLPLTALIYESSQAVGSALPEGVAIASSVPVATEPITTGSDPQPVEFFFEGTHQIQFEKDAVYCFALTRPDLSSADVIRFGFYMGFQQQQEGRFSEARAAWGPQGGASFDLIFYVNSDL